VASYLAEQAGQEALEEVGRFDEFNRRIAFVMHDVKNLSSQMGLLVRNAERHADNPEFRKDMLTTLRNSTDKLDALIARLGRYGAHTTSASERIDLAKLTRRIAQRLRAQHTIQFSDNGPCPVMGDSETLEQAIAHLAQNAIDASASGTPVRIETRNDGLRCSVSIADSGEGMSAQFIRNELFRPFVSTKSGGFGIGAHEAQAAIRGMGGRLDVESREGVGTRFTMDFPIADLETLMNDADRLHESAA
jgi:putative PEP-CTERM system histidine kinase